MLRLGAVVRFASLDSQVQGDSEPLRFPVFGLGMLPGSIDVELRTMRWIVWEIEMESLRVVGLHRPCVLMWDRAVGPLGHFLPAKKCLQVGGGVKAVFVGRFFAVFLRFPCWELFVGGASIRRLILRLCCRSVLG